jgi:hypothetical protein
LAPRGSRKSSPTAATSMTSRRHKAQLDACYL